MPAPDPSPPGRRISLVTTTINVPRCLDDYLRNAEVHGHADRVEVIVVGDRKTPVDTAPFLRDLAARHAADVVFLDVDDQRRLLRRWPSLDLLIRWNCIQRRNIGYLVAAERGAEIIVAADDDNFVTGEDYFGHHSIVGTTLELPVVAHATGWWNVCQKLSTMPARRFYHRGFPKSRQDFTAGGEAVQRKSARVSVNAGLWLKTPDVDATVNIEEPFDVVELEPVDGSRTFALAAGTWCPFNSQNTSFDVRLLPAMYLVVMLDSVRGYRIGRFDDIWMSYFIRAIGDQFGEHVSYGAPLVTQDRNPHNFVRDLSEELAGYVLTEWIVNALRSFSTGCRDWTAAYVDLIYHLRSAFENDATLAEPEREYLRQTLIGMSVWLRAASDVLGSRLYRE